MINYYKTLPITAGYDHSVAYIRLDDVTQKYLYFELDPITGNKITNSGIAWTRVTDAGVREYMFPISDIDDPNNDTCSYTLDGAELPINEKEFLQAVGVI